MNPDTETPQPTEAPEESPATGNKRDYQEQVAGEFDKYDNDMWADDLG
ncbi:hypothetical protein SAMN04489740_1016 [Arthrobacter alpinus]|uniref:Uncharacterized protein n=1 Tax=Arthrobacter alpinus TaxID=656366 RepID=A0A1H5HHB0_9MICC|nr:hypothetical protein [Arthrobacter alpinus]SEE27383.1 hypothetical protein SAMN04489740_1016 [Arthrobacter alpinus]